MFARHLLVLYIKARLVTVMQIYGHRGFSTLIYLMITMITMRSIGPSYKGRSALLVTVMQKYGLRDSSTLIYIDIYDDNHEIDWSFT